MYKIHWHKHCSCEWAASQSIDKHWNMLENISLLVWSHSTSMVLSLCPTATNIKTGGLLAYQTHLAIFQGHSWSSTSVPFSCIITTTFDLLNIHNSIDLFLKKVNDWAPTAIQAEKSKYSSPLYERISHRNPLFWNFAIDPNLLKETFTLHQKSRVLYCHMSQNGMTRFLFLSSTTGIKTQYSVNTIINKPAHKEQTIIPKQKQCPQVYSGFEVEGCRF